MTYVMSDIHGEYEKYLQMLKLIKFSDEDELFVLGDVLDRGPEPIKLIMDMMSREKNVFPLMGNHDLMALDVLSKLMVEITEDNYDTYLTKDIMLELNDWIYNGGDITLSQFRALEKPQKYAILGYIEYCFSPCEAIDIGEKSFIMSHAGLGNFRKDKKMREYTDEELMFGRNDPDVQYFDNENIYLIWGHTPTRVICGEDKIYKSHNNILIDCGACFGGKLACLCLDTMEEFYV